MKTRAAANGQGTIYRRAGRTGWYASIVINGRRKTYHAPTKAEADRLLAAAKTAKENGTLSAAPSQTVENYLTRWLEEVARPRVRPGTYRGYEQLVRVHLIPALGRKRLDRLTPADVQSLLNAKVEAGLSPRTVQYMHAVLRSALKQAHRWSMVPRNVAALVDSPKVEREEIQPFGSNEVRALLDAVAGDRLEALYTVAVTMGLRQGEALGLQWDDVDLEAGTLSVRRQLLRSGGRLELKPLKTARARRTLTMPQVVIASLIEHRRRQIAAGVVPAGYVFAATTGSPLDARNVVRMFKAVLRRASLPDRRFHDLRHSAASLLLVQGVAPKVVQGILGHSQIGVTMDTYSHLVPELHRDAADRIDALFGG